MFLRFVTKFFLKRVIFTSVIILPLPSKRSGSDWRISFKTSIASRLAIGFFACRVIVHGPGNERMKSKTTFASPAPSISFSIKKIMLIASGHSFWLSLSHGCKPFARLWFLPRAIDLSLLRSLRLPGQSSIRSSQPLCHRRQTDKWISWWRVVSVVTLPRRPEASGLLVWMTGCWLYVSVFSVWK